MEALGMWGDMLNVVDSETNEHDARLFVQEDNWDGTQYIRCAHGCSCVFHDAHSTA